MRRAPDHAFQPGLLLGDSAHLFPSHLSELVGPATLTQNSRFSPGNTAKYSGVADCFAQTWREGGARAFYKGFTSNFARLGAWNSAMFVLLEQARAALR